MLLAASSPYARRGVMWNAYRRYYGKPGPKVMRRGLDDFQRIKYGTTLRLHDV